MKGIHYQVKKDGSISIKELFQDAGCPCCMQIILYDIINGKHTLKKSCCLYYGSFDLSWPLKRTSARKQEKFSIIIIISAREWLNQEYCCFCQPAVVKTECLWREYRSPSNEHTCMYVCVCVLNSLVLAQFSELSENNLSQFKLHLEEQNRNQSVMVMCFCPLSIISH